MKAHWKEMAEKFKVGDLVIIPECLSASGKPRNPRIHHIPCPCECFFCGQDSHRIGVITELIDEPVAKSSTNIAWVAQFDVGEWCFYPPDVDAGDVEVIKT
jgi:hypothetical protein